MRLIACTIKDERPGLDHTSGRYVQHTSCILYQHIHPLTTTKASKHSHPITKATDRRLRVMFIIQRKSSSQSSYLRTIAPAKSWKKAHVFPNATKAIPTRRKKRKGISFVRPSVSTPRKGGHACPTSKSHTKKEKEQPTQTRLDQSLKREAILTPSKPKSHTTPKTPSSSPQAHTKPHNLAPPTPQSPAWSTACPAAPSAASLPQFPSPSADPPEA